MLSCESVRELLALDPADDEPGLVEHLAECASCAAYGRRSETLDVLLRAELRWEVPSDLTAHLLALAATPALLPSVRRPSRWYVSLVYVLTVAVVALSLTVAIKFLGVAASELGFSAALTELVGMPGRAIQQLALALPESRYAIDFFLRARDQLMWLLLVAVLWAALDRMGPQAAPVARRTT